MRVQMHRAAGWRGYTQPERVDALPALYGPWTPTEIISMHIGEAAETDAIIEDIAEQGYAVAAEAVRA
jgi:hypothetical protein